MFNSIFSRKLIKYLLSPKKYIVNLEIKVNEKYTFIDQEVIAHWKEEAKEKAIKKTIQEISINFKGLKSLGKIKQLNEF